MSGTFTAADRAANISPSISDMEVDDHVEGKSGLDPALELVERARAGDRDAFGAIYRAHFPAIFRLARLHLGEGAEDVVAETFLRAWKGLPRYKDTGAPFSAWLYAIARHVVVDEVRRRVRTEPRKQVPDQPVEEAGVDRIALARVIERLPGEQRKVIEMKYLLQMRNAEVAAALGKTIGAVNALQGRALRNLRDLLSTEDDR